MTKLTRNLTKFKVKKNNEVINLIKQNKNIDRLYNTKKRKCDKGNGKKDCFSVVIIYG